MSAIIYSAGGKKCLSNWKLLKHLPGLKMSDATKEEGWFTIHYYAFKNASKPILFVSVMVPAWLSQTCRVGLIEKTFLCAHLKKTKISALNDSQLTENKEAKLSHKFKFWIWPKVPWILIISTLLINAVRAEKQMDPNLFDEGLKAADFRIELSLARFSSVD